MKAKKLIMAITALTVSSVSAFAFAACTEGENGGEKAHDYEYTVSTEDSSKHVAHCKNDNHEGANNTLEAHEFGADDKCVKCGAEKPAEGEHVHNYGDWKILSMPSKDGSGKAQKVCANDKEHTHDITVTLPAFDRAGKSEYTAFEEKEHLVTFTYPHESGAITATTVASVKDAIEIAVENKESIVSGTANTYHDYKIYGTQARGEITYEFGDNYMHVNDPAIDRREYFYELNPDGTMFPVYNEWKTISKDGQGENDTTHEKTDYIETLNMKDATPDMMQGFGYFFTWLNGSHKEYGIENFVKNIYTEYCAVNANNDAAASVEVQEDGTLKFNFSVSVHSVLNLDLLHKIDVSFTLDENNVMKTASVKNRTWNNPVQDQSTLLWSVPAGSDYVVMDQYTVTQETERDGEVPTNPYKLEDMLVTSYDMVSAADGKTIVSGDKLEIDANEVFIINLENIEPAEKFNLNFDEITVTLTDSDGNVKDCNPSASELKEGEILAQIIPLRSYDGEKITVVYTLQIKSLLAGTFTLTVKSANITKTLELTVNTIAPSEFGATVYEYNPMNKVWDTDNFNSEFTVYAGQGFNFTSYVAHPFYEETGFTASVTRGEDTNIESDYSFADNTIEGVGVKKFVAAVAGDYTITLTNLKTASNGDPVTKSLTVHVLPAPDMAEVLVGKYFNLNESIELTFEPSVAGATAGVATLVTGVGGRKPVETVLNYSYTEGEGVALTYVSGGEYGGKDTFKLVFDDAYNMTVSYEMAGMGTTRAVYLYNEVPNLIVGTYRITKAASSAVKHVVNIEGKYEITADSYAGVYYGIFDAKTDRQIGGNVSLSPNTVVDLAVGQYIKVWSIGNNTDADGNVVGNYPTQYTITFIPEENNDAQ